MAGFSSLSKEYIRVGVSATEDGVAVDPTGDVVEMALLTNDANPVGGDWKTAEWETAGTTYYARLLVGPGSTVGALAVGSYRIWLRVTDTPEIPVQRAGTFEIF